MELTFRDTGKALVDDSILFSSEREIYEPPYTPVLIKKIIDMQIPLGRIDAVYGRF